jgi:beta-glucosidase/6-phospho-beta-glucosidase/beta-galactosidase
MRDGGKGDMQRPLGVPMDQFDSAWDRIFNKSKIEKVIEETIQQQSELLDELSDHKKECGK